MAIALGERMKNRHRTSKMRVLVVDDSPERTAVLREGLERAGYEVVATLASSLELLRAVEKEQPDNHHRHRVAQSRCARARGDDQSRPAAPDCHVRQ
jgi:hypothetical protein